MKIISRYVAVSFLKSLIFAVVVFSFLICITYVFDRISTVFKLGAPVSLFILSLFYSFPAWLSMIFPIAVLLAVLFSIGDLARNGEVNAMRTSGLSVMQISTPLIAAGLILSVFFMFFDNTLLVSSNKKYMKIWKYQIKKQKYQPNEGFNVVQIENDKIFSAKIIDGNNEKITGLIIMGLDGHMNLKEEITAKTAVWKNGEFELTDASEGSFSGAGGTFTIKKFPLKVIQFAKKPSEFINVKKNPDEMSYDELSDLIVRLNKSGIPSHQEQVHKYSKLAKPAGILIMILLGIPFAIKTAKTAKIFSFAVSIFTGFLYWGAVSLCLALGMNKTIDPFLAAWIPNLIFFVLAGSLIYKTR